MTAGTPDLPVVAQEAQVPVAPGDVSHVCPGCNTGHQNGRDADPRHVVLGASSETTTAILPDGSRVPVQVPVDQAWHFDCHAALGCDHCAEMLANHDGSVKGKAASIQTPDHLLNIEPGEFALNANGVLVRQMTKSEAREAREAEHAEGGIEFIDADAAAELHAKHAAGEI